MEQSFSFSKVGCWKSCPMKYRLRYLDKLIPDDDYTPNNPLLLGSAMHKGIEEGTEKGLELYVRHFPIIDDLHIEEAIKLEYWIPKVRDMLPAGGTFELPVNVGKFIGFLDYVVETDSGLEIYDFKYCSNPEKYINSDQLSIYGYYLSRLKNKPVSKLVYICIPKTSIRRYRKNKSHSRDETLEEFRERMLSDMQAKEITFVEVEYNLKNVVDFMCDVVDMQAAEEYPPTENEKICQWCEYKKVCKEGDYTDMQLPKNERRSIDVGDKKKIYIYGAPFSGKSMFADSFPNVLMLNTDGNVHNLTAPYVSIKDEVTQEGRMVKRKFAWEVLKETILELEKKDNDFETIVIDLLEDTYESCRLYMYNQLGLEHESDDPFRAWDKVRTEFFSVIKRFMNMDYKNLILISHDDTSRDLTRKSGDKVSSVAPNIQAKIANKISGMVDIVVRAVAEGDKYTLSLKRSEVVFGGGRLKTEIEEVPNSYAGICQVYEDAKAHAVTKVNVSRETNTQKQEEVKEEETPKPVEEPTQEEVKEEPVETPKRKRRKKVVEEEEDIEIDRDDLPF